MGKRVAFVIGIGQYNHKEPLTHCPPSADEVYKLLINSEIGACDREISDILLIKKEDETLTESSFTDKLQDIINKLEPGDQFIFFFSGHAAYNERDELLLLLPDAEITTANHWSQKCNFSDICRRLDEKEINNIIMIVDACHSELMFNSMKYLQGNKVGFMASCGKVQYSHSWPSGKPDLTWFAHYFCDGLRNWHDPQYAHITLNKLKRYINKQDCTRKQTVHTLIRDGADEVWIAKNNSFFK